MNGLQCLTQGPLFLREGLDQLSRVRVLSDLQGASEGKDELPLTVTRAFIPQYRIAAVS